MSTSCTFTHQPTRSRQDIRVVGGSSRFSRSVKSQSRYVAYPGSSVVRKKSAREIFQTALQELEELALLDELLPEKPKKLKSPQMEDSEKKRVAVQKLKSKGHKQVEVVKMLGMPKSTVGRFWYAKSTDANE